MDNISINEKVCLKHKLAVNEFLLALAVRCTENLDEAFTNLINREVLVNHGGELMVTQHWSDILDEILVDSTAPSDDNRLSALADKMRECFPKGKMPGTSYYYRCNTLEVKRKLKKFFLQYGQYSDKDVLDATKRYIASFNGNYKYLPLIKYFISKNKKVADEDGEIHVVEQSPLADYLENKEDDNIVTASDDWLMNTRN